MANAFCAVDLPGGGADEGLQRDKGGRDAETLGGVVEEKESKRKKGASGKNLCVGESSPSLQPLQSRGLDLDRCTASSTLTLFSLA